MNTYQILKDKQQAEFNKFPLRAAFSQKQFEEMMNKWNLTVDDTDKICSIGFGCYIRKDDKDAYLKMVKKHKQERLDAVANDKTGNGYIKDMFLYELANHEYCITYDLEDTLDALCLTVEQVNADKRLLNGLNKAIKQYLKNYKDY